MSRLSQEERWDPVALSMPANGIMSMVGLIGRVLNSGARRCFVDSAWTKKRGQIRFCGVP